MRVLIYSTKAFEIPYLLAAGNKDHDVKLVNEALSDETAMLASGFDAVSIFSSDNASGAVLEKLKNIGVKCLALRSAGYDNVALETAGKLGIKVANVPDYSPNAIAEYAAALLLALNRKLIQSNTRVQTFNFNVNGLAGFDLHAKTIGIIGTGRIGAVMVKIMHGFGCRLLGNDINQNKSLSEQYNLKYTGLEELCSRSDIIFIHTPLTPETYHLINSNLICRMRDGVILINTSRGAVLHTQHVIDALEAGKIGAAGLDVYEYEKGVFFKDRSKDIPEDPMLRKLMAMPNVLITSHHAFLTREALANIAETTFLNIKSWDEGKAAPNELFT